MSDITHRLVGYDRQTERVVDEYDVPDDVLPKAKIIAHVPADDPEAALCYQLAENEARDLAGFLNASINPAQRDYFLEGFAA
jgi:hypothetical protein